MKKIKQAVSKIVQLLSCHVERSRNIYFYNNHRPFDSAQCDRKVFLRCFVLLITISPMLNSCCKEGTGGEVEIEVTLKHHGTVIKNHIGWPDTVFVKFNTNQLPGTKPSDFDAYFIGETGETHVHITGLKCGNYFLYAAGIDSAGPYRVTGGIPFKIKHSQRKEKFELEIPVTE